MSRMPQISDRAVYTDVVPRNPRKPSDDARGSIHIHTGTVRPGFYGAVSPTNNFTMALYRDPATGRTLTHESFVLPIDDWESRPAASEHGWNVRIIDGIVMADRYTFATI